MISGGVWEHLDASVQRLRLCLNSTRPVFDMLIDPAMPTIVDQLAETAQDHCGQSHPPEVTAIVCHLGHDTEVLTEGCTLMAVAGLGTFIYLTTVHYVNVPLICNEKNTALEE